MSRYETLFTKLEAEKRIAFIPFVTLGDPNFDDSLSIVESLIAGGADALELGFPFSDPIADGPTIQKAAKRALEAGVSIENCFQLLEKIRQAHPEIPIGLLLYSNLVFKPGMDKFYHRLAQVGVDSILIADVPLLEIQPFLACAEEHGIEQVLILPPDASEEKIQAVARNSQGYIYLLSRSGVTGTETQAELPKDTVIESLKQVGGAPPVLGFGIAEPKQVEDTRFAGASGAISGSAVVKIIEDNLEDKSNMLSALQEFVKKMRAAAG